MKPFIKWVGGKSKLLEHITALMPTNYNRIIEPFVGGGAVMFNAEAKPAVINDFNWQLMALYHQVKTNHVALIKAISAAKVSKEDYLAYRSQDPNFLSKLEVATRVLYLNKVGFNGMWRENSKGGFNVPYGYKDGKTIGDLVSYEQIRLAHARLKTVKIMTGDFQRAIYEARRGDFVFIDPPYIGTWGSYNKDPFGVKEHIQLRQALDYLNNKGIKFMLTNSENDVTKWLYHGYKITSATVSYVVGGANASRGPRNEVLVTNY